MCSACNEEVAYDEIVKGYEYEKDPFVVFSEEELDRLPADVIRAIDIVNFVPLSEIDPVYFQRSYYVAPGRPGRGHGWPRRSRQAGRAGRSGGDYQERARPG